MEVDLVKLLAILAGFTMIIAATVLALRQPISWQHVIVFCLGGVLAGISGVELQASQTNWSVSIGQLKEAADSSGAASLKLADAVESLDQRVDQLHAAVQRVTAANAGRGGTPTTIPSAEVKSIVTSSRAFLARARENTSRVTVPER